MNKTVYFRTFEPEDVPLIHQWRNDDELNKHIVGLNRKISLEEDKKWVNDRIEHNPYQVYWAICSTQTNELIGYTYLINIHYIHQSAQFAGVVIGNKAYQGGLPWIEIYQYVFAYAFEQLNLHRLQGSFMIGHPMTGIMAEAMFFHQDGIMREASYKAGKFYDVQISSILRDEYFEHKEKGEYETRAIMKRIVDIAKRNNKAQQ